MNIKGMSAADIIVEVKILKSNKCLFFKYEIIKEWDLKYRQTM